ncbi:putative Transcription initiation factor TFIID subunit 14b [Monocercomonoides exilis]|uniref:putative Transcription initiation factor TFIID subunit 14b n=1 Tax=Monocercomonoides exilis TaxID=2049356 RepID=UPI003559F295|nr:putative Transcription initiation factor TFIID subunit 14b [Monocercomonoides exilis]
MTQLATDDSLQSEEVLLVHRTISYGNTVQWLGKVNDGQKYVKWTVFVRSPVGEDLSTFISSVTFDLHDDFHPPKRTLKAPPYEVEEDGWGEFTLMISINFKTDDIPPIKFPYHLHLLPTERLTSSNIGETDSFEKCDELIFFDPKQSVLDNLIIQKPNLRTSMTEKLLKPCPLEELTQILCSGIKQVDSDSVRLEEKLLREEYQTKCYKLILKERKRTRRSGMKDVHTSAIEITDRDLEDEVLAGPLTEKEKSWMDSEMSKFAKNSHILQSS